MDQLTVYPGGALRGQARVPGDKSISHRALLLGALAEGAGHVEGFLPSGDCLASLGCLRQLGVQVDQHSVTTLTVHGRGLRGLLPPAGPLNCVRSGTTMRLLAGIMAGQSFDSTLTGEEQLLRRPMGRVVEPLVSMGADITATDGRAPLAVRGRALQGIDYAMPVASAQVKSAVLLAGLYASGLTTVRQPGPARDHTERMLAAMGAEIEQRGAAVTLHPPARLAPLTLTVPGDFSSAAFPLVAAALLAGSEITVCGMGVNPTRTGLLDVLRDMGVDITVQAEREQGNEPVADLSVRASTLHGVEIGGGLGVRMVDEFPILAVAATQAQGATVVRDMAELRVKETDRIATVVAELQALGADIEPMPDGFVVKGPTRLRGGRVSSHGDHRLAMAWTVAGLLAEGPVVVEGAACAADSFPGFVDLMRQLGARFVS
ncbi:MAG: 3-phosphoshikimate 1-carboxyvinyltransferase [Thermoflexales bacterium]|nr:3-phosphoshikimate 1-carboxyvinyltransferase [Thermoflexales bacterium]